MARSRGEVLGGQSSVRWPSCPRQAKSFFCCQRALEVHDTLRLCTPLAIVQIPAMAGRRAGRRRKRQRLNVAPSVESVPEPTRFGTSRLQTCAAVCAARFAAPRLTQNECSSTWSGITGRACRRKGFRRPHPTPRRISEEAPLPRAGGSLDYGFGRSTRIFRPVTSTKQRVQASTSTARKIPQMLEQMGFKAKDTEGRPSLCRARTSRPAASPRDGRRQPSARSVGCAPDRLRVFRAADADRPPCPT